EEEFSHTGESENQVIVHGATLLDGVEELAEFLAPVIWFDHVPFHCLNRARAKEKLFDSLAEFYKQFDGAYPARSAVAELHGDRLGEDSNRCDGLALRIKHQPNLGEPADATAILFCKTAALQLGPKQRSE